MQPSRNLQRRVLALIIGGMALILVLSAYLHRLVTGALVEDDRYNTAVAQTVTVGARIASLELLSNPDALRRHLPRVAKPHPDFEQIDVFEGEPGDVQLVATTDDDAQRLPIVDEHTPDNELKEMEHPAPDVVTMEVWRSGVRYWMISMAIRPPHGTGFVTALVRKNSYSPLVSSLEFQHNLILAGAVVVCGALFSWLFVFFFRRPARDIVQAMVAARGGSFASRVSVRRNDELGEIGHGFNLMMDDLSARDRERETLLLRISGFNTELRAEVERATSELRRSNEDLFEAQQRLARAARLAAVGQVAASLAHEIGTPLNSIAGHLHLLGLRYPDDEETQRRVVIINQQLASIVSSVHALLRRTHRGPALLQPIDLSTVIGDLLRLVSPTLDNHQIKVTTTLVPDGPRVLADRDCLHQVFLNLINNSIDAMPEGGELSIETRIDDSGGAAEVAVRDSGPGIHPEALDRLFEPMWTTKATGNGFGLAIAREILHEHGGGIELDPAVVDGARFRLWVPLAPAGAALARV